MQAAAPVDGIVISEDTRQLVEGYFQLRELDPTEVKGVAQPINIYEVTGAGSLHGHFDLAVRHGLTKFVGRESELRVMGAAEQKPGLKGWWSKVKRPPLKAGIWYPHEPCRFGQSGGRVALADEPLCQFCLLGISFRGRPKLTALSLAASIRRSIF